MKRLVLGLVMAVVASGASATELTRKGDFTPRTHRIAEAAPGVLVLQFRKAFCPDCAQHVSVLEETLSGLSLTESVGLMTVNMDIWQDDPLVRALRVRSTPVMVVQFEGETVGRFERVPTAAAIEAVFAPFLVPESEDVSEEDE